MSTIDIGIAAPVLAPTTVRPANSKFATLIKPSMAFKNPALDDAFYVGSVKIESSPQASPVPAAAAPVSAAPVETLPVPEESVQVLHATDAQPEEAVAAPSVAEPAEEVAVEAHMHTEAEVPHVEAHADAPGAARAEADSEEHIEEEAAEAFSA